MASSAGPKLDDSSAIRCSKSKTRARLQVEKRKVFDRLAFSGKLQPFCKEQAVSKPYWRRGEDKHWTPREPLFLFKKGTKTNLTPGLKCRRNDIVRDSHEVQTTERRSLKLPMMCQRARFETLNAALFEQLRMGQVFIRLLQDPNRKDGKGNFPILSARSRHFCTSWQIKNKKKGCGKKQWVDQKRMKMSSPSYVVEEFLMGKAWFETTPKNPKTVTMGLCLNVSGLPIPRWQEKKKQEQSHSQRLQKHLKKTGCTNLLKQMKVCSEQDLLKKRSRHKKQKLQLWKQKYQKSVADYATKLKMHQKNCAAQAKALHERIALAKEQQAIARRRHAKRRFGVEMKKAKRRLVSHTKSCKRKLDGMGKNHRRGLHKFKRRFGKVSLRNQTEVSAYHKAKKTARDALDSQFKQEVKAIRGGYEKAQKKDATNVYQLMKRHYQMMAKTDPEWQVIARSAAEGILHKEHWASQYQQVDLCSSVATTNDAQVQTNKRCKAVPVCAVAVQPDPTTPSWVSHLKISYSEGEWDAKKQSWQPTNWRFYSATTGPEPANPSITNSGDVVRGSADVMDTGGRGKVKPRWNLVAEDKQPWSAQSAKNVITKTLLQAPVKARFVRLHPVCWHGPSMAMRAELFGCVQHFNWSFMKTRATSLPADKALECNSLMAEAHVAFSDWTDGLDGSGVSFETEPEKISVSGRALVFRATQKRAIVGKGVLMKQLLCYQDESKVLDGGSCCVTKQSRSLNGHWSTQTATTQMF